MTKLFSRIKKLILMKKITQCYISQSKLLLLIMVLAISQFVTGQQNNAYWSKASISSLRGVDKVHRASHPEYFEVFNLSRSL